MASRYPHEEAFMKELRCRDVGNDCDEVIRGDSEEEVMRRATEHARRDHHQDRISDQQSREMRAHIRET
jgi:predicted small metal-binding protein